MLKILENRIEDILLVINNSKLQLDDMTEYYNRLLVSLDDIKDDYNMINQLHENITYNRNIIIEVCMGIKPISKLDYLYKLYNIHFEKEIL